MDIQTLDPLELAGEWEFYWEQLLTPEVLASSVPRKGLMHVPGTWTHSKEGFPSFGYATYRLRVLLESPQHVSLYFPPSIWSAARIYVDGEEIAHFGEMGTNEETAKGGLGIILHGFQTKDNSFDIVVQVANFEIFLAGIAIAPQMGSLTSLMERRAKGLMIDVFVVGALFIMGLYNFCLYILRTKVRSTLWFGCLCVFIAVYVSSMRAGLIEILLPGLGFNDRLRVFNLSWVAAVASFTWFVHHAFKEFYARWLCQLTSCVTLALCVVILLTPAKVFVPPTNAYHVLTACVALYTLYAIIRACRAKASDSSIFLGGLVMPLVATFSDLLSIRRIIEAPTLAGFGLLGFVFFQSFLIARRFSRAFEQAEHLSDNLQQEVKNQTYKLEAQRDKLIEQKKEIVQAHEELQRHDEQKTRFFQNISHELRTPLTLILGSLSQAEKSEQESKPIQVAARNSKRLLRLVNQLLDFQKLSVGEGDLQLKKLDLQAFLNSISQYFQPTCEQRGIRFQLDVTDRDLDRVMVNAHIDALEKIVFNYLSNALKFTPHGGEIRLTLVKVGPMARIQVADTGPGIPQDKISHLFKVFSQVDGSTKREFEGTGLGLALAKELAVKMQGSVGVDSQPGRGSIFWVDLPLCFDASHTIDLLVVDDDAALSQQIQDELLQRQICENFQVVGSANEARAVLSRYRVHCVLSDAVMPDEDGPTLLAHVAQEQPHCKRILITARSRSHRIVQKAINTARIDRIFYKPFTSELFSVLKTLIDEAKIQHSAKILDLLVIDDEESVLKSIRMMLLDSDSVTTFELVKDLDRARQMMRSHRIRCVLVDANLTAADGTDFLMEIAGLQPDCHRIMITGESGPEVLEKAINKARIDHVIYKPLQKQDLLSRVEEAIRQSPIQAPSEIEESISSDYQPKDWLLADVQAPVGLAPHDPSLDAASAPSREETILVVDDVDDMRDLIQTVLRRQGYRVVGARNGEEALGLLQNQAFDLIITDWMMPRKSGPELLADLQKDPRLAGIPTILLTAKGDDVSKVVAAREGASAYLAKPFDEVELHSTVANLLKLKEGERTIAALNRDLTENILKRFLPPHLVNEIALGHREFINEAKLSPVTILFADLCQFTKTSEELGPRRISLVLNQYFDAMTEVIFQEGGTIDKFIGDAVMVIFGAPEAMPVEEQVEKACRCARLMHEGLAALGQTWESEGMPRFEMRIGIHHGPATVGMFGGSRRSDYTVIGPTVNLASRVESVASPGEILMTSVVRDYLRDDNWEKAGSFNLKGVGGGITLYRLKQGHRKAA
ncbi:response regulator [Oligoflexus tunisiensis]|uniref:response regulator n=1 Tax=Oligoflexus tunisiensis TaxID=708132 RepID=UPI00159F03B1|nr:response regulator [Oligoflexus tunisiensis]